MEMGRDHQKNAFIHFLSPLNSLVVLEPIPVAFGPHQFITQDKQATARTYGQLRVPPNHLTCIFLECGRKPESPEENPQTQGSACKLHTERAPRRPPGIEPATFLLSVTQPLQQRSPDISDTNVLFLQPWTSE